ncbi:MAG: trigger factor [Proteobacteria bacterium]|nr:trigger factor [Pseudomonadota bacterium]
MQVTETQSEGLKHEFQIVVPADAIEGKLQGKLTEIAATVTLPGFRRGKAPVKLLRKTYGKRLLGEILEETVNETATQTLEDKSLRPAMQPEIEVTKFDDGGDLEYTLKIEAMPEFETGDFSDITLERMVAKVEDDVVDERLQALAQQMKTYIDAAEGEGANDGDVVVIDFEGRVDGEVFEGGSAEGFELELGSGRFIPGFEEQLAGAKKDESREVEVTFPEEYGEEKLAGKAATFSVTVKAVRVALPAPVDDSLAEKLGMADLEALKTTLGQQVEREYGQYSRAQQKRALLDQLADRYDFELPPRMVEMEFEGIWEQLQGELEQQEKTLDDLDKPEDELRADYRGIAERRVRLGLLLSEVGRRNNIEVTQEEINRAIMERTRMFPGQEQQVFQFYQQNPDQQAQLRAPILEDKVCDYIFEMATVNEREVPVEELMRDPDAEPEAEDSSDEAESDDKAADEKD